MGGMVWRVTAPIAAAAFLIGASVSLSSGPAQAKKCIAEATGFPCKKCHNSPTGGKEEGWNAYGEKYKAKMAGHYPC
ncbi:MAG: hypothetical protein KGM42_05890 [Hyphomicrobiales bacterium]|nr:hypothetical protein [Hyphomicrobiales bacterium]